MLLVEAFDSAGQKIDAVNLQFGLIVLAVAIIIGIFFGYLCAESKRTNRELETIEIIKSEKKRFEKKSLEILHQLYGEKVKTIDNINHVFKVFQIRMTFYIMMRGFLPNRSESDIHDIVSDLIEYCKSDYDKKSEEDGKSEELKESKESKGKEN